MTVPYTFATATNTIPLSQLDSNFATAITLGNTAIQLGNTVTTLNNMTLANVTVSSGNLTITNVSVTTANVTTANIATSIVTASETLSYGTANGVLYLNASKVATSGSALTFDGSTLYNSGNISVGGNSGGNRYVAILNETGTYTGTLMLQAGGGSASYGGAVVMYGHSHASYPGAVYVGSSAGTSTGIIFGGGGNAGPATSEWMRLTSTGLGVGTSSPTTKLDVNGDARIGGTSVSQSLLTVGGGSTSAAVNLRGATGSAYAWQISSNAFVGSALEFTRSTAVGGTTFSTPSMLLDSSGNLGIGTTSPSGKISVVETAGGSPAIRIQGDSSTNVGRLSFTDNGVTRTNALLTADNSGNLAFATNGTTERARIDSSGNLLVGTTSASAKLSVEAAGSALYIYRTTAGGTAVFRNGDDAGYGIAFQNSSGGTAGSIYWTASATTYATSSDYRLKTLVGAVTGSGERIDALQPVEFDWKADGKRARGFFADKFQEVYPDSVSGEKDAVDAEGNPVYQSMQASTSEVIADLVAELQSLRKRVAQLEGK